MQQSNSTWLIYFAALNALLAAAITSTIIPVQDFGASLESILFMVTALLGHFLFFSLLLLLPVLLLKCTGLPDRHLLLAAIIIFSSFMIILFINAQVFSIYRFHLNSMVINLLSGDDALEILSIRTETWLVLMFGLLVVIIAELFLARQLLHRLAHHPHRPRIFWLSALLIMLGSQFYYAYADATGNRTVARLLQYIPWSIPLTAKRKLAKLGIDVALQPPSRSGRIKSSGLSYPRNRLDCQPDRSSTKNILLIVVDSLRQDVMNASNMPNTMRLAQSSWEFKDHYSTGNATRFGFFGLMYGLPGSYWFPMLAEQKGPVLIETLQAQNYQFIVRGSASWASPEFDRTVFSAIRDQIVSGKELKEMADNETRHRDSVTSEDFLAGLAKRDPQRPFFGLLFLDAPHNYTREASAPAPFQPALDYIDYLDLDGDYDPKKFFNLYRNSVYYNDMLVGDVLKTLEKQSLLDDTVIIFTADHGQEFNDSKQNYWGHNGNFSSYQTRVPLLIHWPGTAARSVHKRTSHEDIVPTLMQKKLGCINPVDDYSTGQNLYSADYRSKPLLLESWSRRALLDKNRVYVFEAYGETRVHDLSYRVLEQEVPNSAIILKSMQQMSMFLK
ncbi:MAG: membrane-anchored protein YejM (alkaline phosphatase superfamily) [Planctomycetota bacterium]